MFSVEGILARVTFETFEQDGKTREFCRALVIGDDGASTVSVSGSAEWGRELAAQRDCPVAIWATVEPARYGRGLNVRHDTGREQRVAARARRDAAKATGSDVPWTPEGPDKPSGDAAPMPSDADVPPAKGVDFAKLGRERDAKK